MPCYALQQPNYPLKQHAVAHAMRHVHKLQYSHQITQTTVHFPWSPISRLLCKYNLHQLVCRLVRQAELRGHSSNYNELFGENYIQYCKSSTKYRSTTCPEKVIVKTLLVDAALARLSVSHPEHTRTFDQLIPKYRSGQMRGRNIDVAGCSSEADEEDRQRVGGASTVGGEGLTAVAGAASGAAAAARAAGGEGEIGGENGGPGDVPLLLGSGKPLQGEDVARVEQSIRARLEDKVIGWPPLEGWHMVWVDAGAALAYQHADQGGGGFSFKSLAYTRALQRVSYFALVRYEEGSGVAAYVAKIHFFVKLTPTSRAAAQEAAEQLREAAAALVPSAAPAPARGRGRGRRGRGRRGRGAQQRRNAAEEAAAAAETAAEGPTPSTLRLALCDLYKATEFTNWRGTGYYVSNMEAPWKPDVALPLDELTQKVVVCSRLFDKSAQRTEADIQPSAWFITYENLSRTTLL